MRILQRGCLLLTFVGALAGSLPAVEAQTYPERPVRFIVGTNPGGTVDYLARLVATKLTDKWRQAVNVENKPGADGIIAADLVAKADPDGYTLDFIGGQHTIAPTQHDLTFDPVADFEPVILAGRFPDVLVVNPEVMPVTSVSEMIEYIKARPDEVNYASGGGASPPFFEAEVLAKETGMKMQHVPFKGTGPALISLLGGETQLLFGSIGVTTEHIHSGKLRALAVSTNVRTPVLPDVPTIEEATGLKDFDFGNWYGLLAPAGTPPEIVNKLRDDVAAVLNDPEIAKRLEEQGFIPIVSTPAEFKDFLAKDIPFWKKLYDDVDDK